MNGGKAMKGVYEGYFESEQAISDSCFRMRVLRAILIVILLFPHMLRIPDHGRPVIPARNRPK